MKIEKIKKEKNGTYKLIMENDELITSDDVILKYNLLFKKDIDNDTYKKVKDETVLFEEYNKVLKYVLKKMRSTKEVKIYMEKLNLSNKKQDLFLKKLQDKGFLNDEKFIKAYISEKMNLSNDGPLKIKNYLEQQELDSNIIDDTLNDYNDFVKEKLEKLIKKKKGQNKKYSEYIWKNKVVYYLENLGYYKEMVEEMYDKIPSNKEDDLKEREYQKLKKKLSIKYKGEELEKQIKIRMYQKGFFDV